MLNEERASRTLTQLIHHKRVANLKAHFGKTPQATSAVDPCSTSDLLRAFEVDARTLHVPCERIVELYFSPLHEHDWEWITREYLTRLCSGALLDLHKIRAIVVPSETPAGSVKYIFRRGAYREVHSFRHYLAQLIKSIALQELTMIFGLERNEALAKILNAMDHRRISNLADKLTLFLTEKQEIRWEEYAMRGEDPVFLENGSMLLIRAAEIARIDQHSEHNTFAIPAEISYDPPTWYLQFVTERFGQAKEAWLDFLAITLAPTSWEKCFAFLVGPQDAGKSVVLDQMFLILGRESVGIVNMSQLHERSFHLARLVDKLLVIAHEGKKEKADEALLKAAASREYIMIDRKFREAFEGKAIARLLLATNNMPVIADPSDASVGRMWVFQLEKIPPEKHVPRAEILRKTAEEAPRIRGLLIRRIQEIRRRGGLHPETEKYLERVRRQILLDQNPVAEFWLELVRSHQDVFERGRKGVLKIAKDTAYEAYRAFCERYGYQPLQAANFKDASTKLTSYYPLRIEFKANLRLADRYTSGFYVHIVGDVGNSWEPFTHNETLERQAIQDFVGVVGKSETEPFASPSHPDCASRSKRYPQHPQTTQTLETQGFSSPTTYPQTTHKLPTNGQQGEGKGDELLGARVTDWTDSSSNGRVCGTCRYFGATFQGQGLCSAAPDLLRTVAAEQEPCPYFRPARRARARG